MLNGDEVTAEDLDAEIQRLLKLKIERFPECANSLLEAYVRDAERYRFLEHQCRTGSYRGIISREAIDAAIASGDSSC